MRGKRKAKPLRWWVAYGLASFLPGRLVLGRGRKADYEELERFHYRPKRPATWAEVWVVRYEEGSGFRVRGSGQRGSGQRGVGVLECRGVGVGECLGLGGRSRVVAVGVVSYPTLAHRERERILGLKGMSNEARARFVNEHVRTISRVAVHPTFRSLGLAGVLVKCILYHCSTRYVEAMAVMGRAHPFFELAGMKRVPAGDGEEERPVYYLYDRLKQGRGRWEHAACDVVMGVG